MSINVFIQKTGANKRKCPSNRLYVGYQQRYLCGLTIIYATMFENLYQRMYNMENHYEQVLLLRPCFQKYSAAGKGLIVPGSSHV